MKKTTSKLISVILSLMLIFGTMPITAFADNLTWSFDNGTLTISGNGAMDNYDNNNPGWYTHANNISKIIINEGVTSIGDYAFYYEYTNLTEVHIPKSVKTIGEWAFYTATSLETVSFAANSELETIKKSAFHGCSSLETISIPESVNSILANAFNGSGLKTVNFEGNEIDQITSTAFAGVNGASFNLTSGFKINYPDGTHNNPTIITVDNYSTYFKEKNFVFIDGSIEVYFVNEGTVVQKNGNVTSGTTVNYTGLTPQKEGNYEFAGWDPEIGAVTEDTVYTATFTETTPPVTTTDVVVDFGTGHGTLAASYANSKGYSVSGSQVTVPVEANNKNEAQIAIADDTASILTGGMVDAGEMLYSPFLFGSQAMSEYDSQQDLNDEVGSYYETALSEGDTFCLLWMQAYEGEASITYTASVCGTAVHTENYGSIATDHSVPQPEVAFDGVVSDNPSGLSWFTDYEEGDSFAGNRFVGTIVGGTSYYTCAYIRAPFSYYIDDTSAITTTGAENVWFVETDSVNSPGLYTAIAEVKAVHDYDSSNVCTACGDVLDGVSVIWQNYDGTELETDTVSRGFTPTYDGETPVKPEDSTYVYTFSGWDPEVGPATEDTTVYTAQYSQTSKPGTLPASRIAITSVTANTTGTATINVLITDDYGHRPSNASSCHVNAKVNGSSGGGTAVRPNDDGTAFISGVNLQSSAAGTVNNIEARLTDSSYQQIALSEASTLTVYKPALTLEATDIDADHATGSITVTGNLDRDLEYRNVEGGAYQDCGAEITGLAAGTYRVRTKPYNPGNGVLYLTSETVDIEVKDKIPDNGSNLTLGDNIKTTIYIDADAYDVDENEGVIKVTYNKNTASSEPNVVTETIPLTDLDKYTVNNEYKGTYMFYYSCAPAQLTETCTVSLYANESDDTAVYTSVYSAKGYCDDVNAKYEAAQEPSEELRKLNTLCNALVDYAKAAQIKFDYKKDLTGDYKDGRVQTLTASQMDATENDKNGVVQGFAFDCQDELNIFAYTETEVTPENVSIAATLYNDKINASADAKDTYNFVRIKGIGSGNLGKVITFDINGTTVKVSAAAIAKAYVASDNENINSDMKDLARAIYLYGVAAEDYFYNA